jgi:ferredoxin--NADP+ reductase
MNHVPYVILGTCVNDAACVKACPVDAIHPTPLEADFATADMLYIDSAVCVSCNACAEACPVQAIVPADRLPERFAIYREINVRLAQARPR